jgi:adenylate cyclase
MGTIGQSPLNPAIGNAHLGGLDGRLSSFTSPCLTMSPQLSAGIIYYIRKLLRQNLDRLHFYSPTEDGIKADAMSNLNAVLLSLYGSEAKVAGVVSELERLTIVHQTLSGSASINRLELQNTEETMFSLFGFRMQEQHRKGNVLVVDDVPTNVTLLANALGHQGYDVKTATNGKNAIAAAQDAIPDVVLLDIMMPDLDGYSVCEQLKTHPLTRDVPVIFVSAVYDAASKVKAFKAGGADYITKPFQIEEVLARVEHQLKLRTLQKRLEAQNMRLQAEISDRKQAEERYRGLFENATEGMFQTTPAGKYLNANAALAMLYGYESSRELIENIGNIADRLYADAGRRDEINALLTQQDSLVGIVSKIRCRDGSVMWISENIRAVKDAQGKLAYYEGSAQDVTVNHQLEIAALQFS